MAIETNYISAVSHSEDTSTAIEIFDTPPLSQASSVGLIPNRLVGYYNSQNDRIQLYVVDPTGLRYIPVKLYAPQ
jgi:hypothetical protein